MQKTKEQQANTVIFIAESGFAFYGSKSGFQFFVGQFK
jgi:hypothetical protein